MNTIVILSIISLSCLVAMTTAFYGPVGGYSSYSPMYYGGGAGGMGDMGGSFFSIIIFLVIISILGKGNLFGGGKRY